MHSQVILKFGDRPEYHHRGDAERRRELERERELKREREAAERRREYAVCHQARDRHGYNRGEYRRDR